MPKIVPASSIRSGDIVLIFGRPWTVKKIDRKDGLLHFFFLDGKEKPLFARPDTELSIP